VWLRGGGKRPATKTTYYRDDKYRQITTTDVGTDTEPNCFFVHLDNFIFSLGFWWFRPLHRVFSLEISTIQ
jgi:hypothetical protein